MFNLKREKHQTATVISTITHSHKQDGIILIWTIFLLPLFFAIVALTIDMGYQQMIKNELSIIANSASHSGAIILNRNNISAINHAKKIIKKNLPNNNAYNNIDIKIDIGFWNENLQTFFKTRQKPNAMQVQLSVPNETFFLRLSSLHTPTIKAKAISYKKRDAIYQVQ